MELSCQHDHNERPRTWEIKPEARRTARWPKQMKTGNIMRRYFPMEALL